MPLLKNVIVFKIFACLIYLGLELQHIIPWKDEETKTPERIRYTRKEPMELNDVDKNFLRKHNELNSK